MVPTKTTDPSQLTDRRVAELKLILFQMIQGRDKDALKDKVQFYKDKLAPIVEELSHHNPFAIAEEQVSPISGVWSPIWSTIPFWILFQDACQVSLIRFSMKMVIMRTLHAILPVATFLCLGCKN